MSAKHRPTSLRNYLDVHATVMGHFVDQGFVLDEALQVEDLGDGALWMHGPIRCTRGVTITVNKYLTITDAGPPVMVQTSQYSYNASVDGIGNVFRYCSAHPDHNTYHHRHAYDVFAGDDIGTVSKVTGDWPSLGEVIEELREWTSTHSDRLPP